MYVCTYVSLRASVRVFLSVCVCVCLQVALGHTATTATTMAHTPNVTSRNASRANDGGIRDNTVVVRVVVALTLVPPSSSSFTHTHNSVPSFGGVDVYQ